MGGSGLKVKAWVFSIAPMVKVKVHVRPCGGVPDLTWLSGALFGQPTTMMAALALLLPLLATLPSMAIAGRDAPFELVLALPHRSLDELEAKFWSIADPKSDDYLQHMSVSELEQLIGASPADIAAAKRWLEELGASRSSVGALGDTVVGVFDGVAHKKRAHWVHHWSPNADGVPLPTPTNHTRLLDYVLRRDRTAPPEPVHASSIACQIALRASCSTDAAKAHSPFASEPCG